MATSSILSSGMDVSIHGKLVDIGLSGRESLQTLQYHQGDVVVLRGGTGERIDAFHHLVDDRVGGLLPMGLEHLDHAVHAELLIVSVFGFGDTIGVNHQQVAGKEGHPTLLISGPREQSYGKTRGGQQFHGSIAAKHDPIVVDRKSTRLNSSHLVISYAVF